MLAGLADEADEIARRTARLAAAERAREVTPLLGPLLRAEHEEAEAAARAEHTRVLARQALRRLHAGDAPDDPDLDGTLPLARTPPRPAGGRRRRGGTEQPTSPPRSRALETRLLAAEAEQAALRSDADTLPARVETLRAAVTAAEHALSGLDRARADVAAAAAVQRRRCTRCLRPRPPSATGTRPGGRQSTRTSRPETICTTSSAGD